MGYTLDEICGKSIWEIHGSDYHRTEVRTPSGSDIRPADSLSHRPSLDNRSAEFVKEVKVYVYVFSLHSLVSVSYFPPFLGCLSIRLLEEGHVTDSTSC